MLSRALLFALITTMGTPLFAEHLPGGTISYTCLGGNYFQIKLSLWRECSGNAMIAQKLHFVNTCGVVFSSANLTPVLVEGPVQICDQEQQNTNCQGGALTGFERYEFTIDEIFLSPCDSWTIYWSICCRPVSVNVQSIPGLYIETRIANVTEACNSSPQFEHTGIPRVCVNETVNYNAGVMDTDGNRIAYSLIDARQAMSIAPNPLVVNSVNYVFPNYGGEPVVGMTLDPATGQIQFTPTTIGYVIVAVQVDEYNADDEWIGSIMLDFPFYVEACSNTSPAIGSGTITASSGSAEISGDRSFSTCASGSGCVTIAFADADASQNVSLWSNVDHRLPGATMQITGTNPVQAEICWDVIDLPAGSYFFVITAMDDACPVRGMRSYVFEVEIEGPDAGSNNTALACELALEFALIDSLAGTPMPGGYWTDPDGSGHSGYFNGSTDQPGPYLYTVTEGACTDTSTLVIEFLPPEDSLCILMPVGERNAPEFSIHPNPTTGQVIFAYSGSIGAPFELFDARGVHIGRIGNVRSSQGMVELRLPADLANGPYTLHTFSGTGVPLVARVLLTR